MFHAVCASIGLIASGLAGYYFFKYRRVIKIVVAVISSKLSRLPIFRTNPRIANFNEYPHEDSELVFPEEPSGNYIGNSWQVTHDLKNFESQRLSTNLMTIEFITEMMVEKELTKKPSDKKSCGLLPCSILNDDVVLYNTHVDTLIFESFINDKCPSVRSFFFKYILIEMDHSAFFRNATGHFPCFSPTPALEKKIMFVKNILECPTMAVISHLGINSEIILTKFKILFVHLVFRTVQFGIQFWQCPPDAVKLRTKLEDIYAEKERAASVIALFLQCEEKLEQSVAHTTVGEIVSIELAYLTEILDRMSISSENGTCIENFVRFVANEYLELCGYETLFNESETKLQFSLFNKKN